MEMGKNSSPLLKSCEDAELGKCNTPPSLNEQCVQAVYALEVRISRI